MGDADLLLGSRRTVALPGEPPATALAALARALDRVGYGELVSCFGPLVPRPDRWRVAARFAPARLRPVVDLFLLGERTDPDALPGELLDLVPDLVELGLLVEHQGATVGTPGLVVLFVLGTWIICQPPQTNPSLYLGEDSVALLCHLAPSGAARCLDLCAGPGLHALHCARFAPQVTAVESDPVASRLATWNTQLNGIEHRMVVMTGDLYEPVYGQRFDLVTANPPSLPYPVGLQAPAVGDGGEDGFEVTWRILDGLAEALDDDGRAHIVGMTLSRDGILCSAERLGTVASATGLDIRCSIVSHSRLVSGEPWFEALVAAVSSIAGVARADGCDAYSDLLRRQGADHLTRCFLHVRRGAGQLELVDLSATGATGRWHV